MAKRVASKRTSTVKAKRRMGTAATPKKTARKKAGAKPAATKGRPARTLTTGL